MSDPNPGIHQPARAHGSRYLFLFLLGLVVGAVGVVMALRAWDARKDHFPESLMHVQGWHMDQLGKAVEQNRCAATDTLPHLKALRTTADDLERAFPEPRRRPALQRTRRASCVAPLMVHSLRRR